MTGSKSPFDKMFLEPDAPLDKSCNISNEGSESLCHIVTKTMNQEIVVQQEYLSVCRKCDKCETYYDSITTATKCLSSHGWIRCFSCFKALPNSKKAIIHHLQEFHKNTNPPGLLKCPFCTVKSQEYCNLLQDHVLNSHPENKFIINKEGYSGLCLNWDQENLQTMNQIITVSEKEKDGFREIAVRLLSHSDESIKKVPMLKTLENASNKILKSTRQTQDDNNSSKYKSKMFEKHVSSDLSVESSKLPTKVIKIYFPKWKKENTLSKSLEKEEDHDKSKQQLLKQIAAIARSLSLADNNMNYEENKCCDTNTINTRSNLKRKAIEKNDEFTDTRVMKQPRKASLVAVVNIKEWANNDLSLSCQNFQGQGISSNKQKCNNGKDGQDAGQLENNEIGYLTEIQTQRDPDNSKNIGHNPKEDNNERAINSDQSQIQSQNAEIISIMTTSQWKSCVENVIAQNTAKSKVYDVIEYTTLNEGSSYNKNLRDPQTESEKRDRNSNSFLKHPVFSAEDKLAENTIIQSLTSEMLISSVKSVDEIRLLQSNHEIYGLEMLKNKESDVLNSNQVNMNLFECKHAEYNPQETAIQLHKEALYSISTIAASMEPNHYLNETSAVGIKSCNKFSIGVEHYPPLVGSQSFSKPNEIFNSKQYSDRNSNLTAVNGQYHEANVEKKGCTYSSSSSSLPIYQEEQFPHPQYSSYNTNQIPYVQTDADNFWNYCGANSKRSNSVPYCIDQLYSISYPVTHHPIQSTAPYPNTASSRNIVSSSYYSSNYTNQNPSYLQQSSGPSMYDYFCYGLQTKAADNDNMNLCVNNDNMNLCVNNLYQNVSQFNGSFNQQRSSQSMFNNGLNGVKHSAAQLLNNSNQQPKKLINSCSSKSSPVYNKSDSYNRSKFPSLSNNCSQKNTNTFKVQDEVMSSLPEVNIPPSSSLDQEHRSVDESNKECAKIICEICGKEFRGKNAKLTLNRHKELLHEGICRFICKICSRQFSRPSKFRKHAYEQHNVTLPELPKRSQQVHVLQIE